MMPCAEFLVVGMNIGTGTGNGNGTGTGYGLLYMCIGAGTYIGTGTGISTFLPMVSSANNSHKIYYRHHMQMHSASA